MPRESKSSRLQRIHSEAMRAFGAMYETMIAERRQCVEDRRFASVAGAQWEGPLEEILEGRPRMEFNKCQMAVTRVINEMRAANIGIKFSPRDPDALADDGLADLCAGTLRADEFDSSADEAYGNGEEEAITGGFGAWQLRADYVDDNERTKQRIRIEPIYDADGSVFFDLDAKQQDKSDARRCWVLKSMTPAAYMDEFDQPDPATWPKDTLTSIFDWATPDVVYVCEFYTVGEVKQRVEVWQSIAGEEQEINDDDYSDDEYEAETARLTSLGWVLVREDKRKVREVRKYIMDGQKVLEDCGRIAGRYIPVIPIYGKRWFIENVERCAGVVRYVKDAQRLKNMQLSKLAEIAALSSREKPIFTSEQIAGHELDWRDDNLKDFPYQTINGVDDNGQPLPQGPVGYTKPPSVPPALAALYQATESEIREILGSPEQGEKLLSGVSGEAISLVQQRADGVAAIYLTNKAKALKHSARVWLAMAADVYVEPKRKMRVMANDDEVEFQEINRPKLGEGGELVEGLDFERARFDVYTEIGPNSTSARQATVRAVASMMGMTQDPEDLKILMSMAIMNMDGEGIGDLRKFYRRRLVTLGAVEPTDEEAAQLQQAAQNQRPDPQAQFLETEAEKNRADAQRTMADARRIVADTAKTEAETVKIVSETMRPKS